MAAVPAYVAGKPPPTGAARTFKLSSNENPYPPLPGVIAAAAAHFAAVAIYALPAA